MKVEVTQIKLQLNDRVIELTMDEAKAVQAELNRFFEQAEPAPVYQPPVHPFPSYPTTPAPYFIRPYYIEPSTPSWPSPWYVTCGTPTGLGVPGSSPDLKNKTVCMDIGHTH